MNIISAFVFVSFIVAIRGIDDYFDNVEADEKSDEPDIVTKRNSKLDESEITLIERSGENFKTDTILAGMETLKESPLVLRTPDISKELKTEESGESLLEGKSDVSSQSERIDEKSGTTEANAAVEDDSETKEGESQRSGNNFDDHTSTVETNNEEREDKKNLEIDNVSSKSSEEPTPPITRRMMSDTKDMEVERKEMIPDPEVEERSGQSSADVSFKITPNIFGTSCCGRDKVSSFHPTSLPIPRITNPFLLTIPKNINSGKNYNLQMRQNFFNARNEPHFQDLTTLKSDRIGLYNEYPFGSTTAMPQERFPVQNLMPKLGLGTEQRKLFEQNNENYFKTFPRLPQLVYQPQRSFVYPYLPGL